MNQCRVRDVVRRGRPKPPLLLSVEVRVAQVRWCRRAETSQAREVRRRISRDCAEDGGLRDNQDVAAALGSWPQTVTRWRRRFLDRRLEGLVDEPRPGAPRRITDDQVEQVIVKTLEATPADATHWSRASMAAQSGLSRSSVGRIWKALGLKPHLTETFKLSTDPQFVDKVRDVVGLYLDPPEKALVLAVDEKSQIQALDRSAPVLPMMPGMPERRTHDYLRHGITTLVTHRRAGRHLPGAGPSRRDPRRPQPRREDQLAGCGPPHQTRVGSRSTAPAARNHNTSQPGKR